MWKRSHIYLRANEKTESSEERGIILNCISYQHWLQWIGGCRAKTWICVANGWLCTVLSSKQGARPPGTACSGSSELFLQQSNRASFCSPQELLASGSVKAKLAPCVPRPVFSGEIFSAEHLVIFPTQQCAFGDDPPRNCTRRGPANSLHIPKHIYLRHVKRAITRTQLPAYATVGSILFLAFYGDHRAKPFVVGKEKLPSNTSRKQFVPQVWDWTDCPTLKVDTFLYIC